MKYVLCLSFLIFFAALTLIDVDADVHEDVICDEGKEIVFKPSDGIPICVKSSSVLRIFVKRGYTIPTPAQEITTYWIIVFNYGGLFNIWKRKPYCSTTSYR